MAVTKIRKISSYTLLVLMIISLVVCGLFYFGGVAPGTETAEISVPAYTELLLYWTYIIFCLTLVFTVIFAFAHLVSLFKDNFRSALNSLAAIIAFFALFFIGYALGSGAPINIPGYDGNANTPFWLRVTDMWLYTTYILLVIIFAALIWGSIRKAINKK